MASAKNPPTAAELIALGSPVNEHGAARILGVTVSFLQQDRLRRKHGIPYLKLGSAVRYQPSALLEWMEQCARPKAEAQT